MTDAMTYDDVLLVPSYNHWESRKIVDTSMTDKTGKLHLDLPVMTANMDTVTETAMADFIGAKGGIGVMHRFMSIEDNIDMFKACAHKAFRVDWLLLRRSGAGRGLAGCRCGFVLHRCGPCPCPLCR